ncbi:MAG: TIM barrel protein [Oscillospiraceae bacterium]|nr:TIM barrel protein [Oscillospiraceae bacterium]
MKTNYDIKLGVSLYSYQDNYYFHRHDLEGCIAAAAGAGAEGIEVFSDAMIPEWPYVSDAWIDKWNGWMQRYDVEPVCLDHFSDRMMWHDKQLTDEEMFERGVMYIKLARRLGCKAIRVLHEEHIGPKAFVCKLTDYDIIARLLPIAAENDVMLALEVHTSDGVGAPYQQKYIELAEKTGIPYVGLQQDFSTFSYCLSTADIVTQVAESGANKEVLMAAREEQRKAYFGKYDFDEAATAALIEKLNPSDADRLALHSILPSLKMPAGFVERRPFHGASRKAADYEKLYKDLYDNASKLVYCHGKFYDIDENGQVDDMDYPTIFKTLIDGGYKGYIASEFEGNRRMNMAGWCDEIEYVRKHHKLMRSLLGRE